MTLLLVEDDKTILDGLKFCLTKENFDIKTAPNGREALKELDNNKIDLLILDINLPDINGIELYKKIKNAKDIPTIFLTANDLETTVVEALDTGADDYITKPFKTRELISRINSVLRRVYKKENSNKLEIKNIKINLNEATVYKDNEKIFLTALEYKILLILFMHPSRVFTRESILAEIWDTEEEYVNDNTLTVYIKRIREKLEDDPTNPKIIMTVRGLGYKVDYEN